MGLAKWESFLGEHIEGFFNKSFGSALEPVELMKHLEREMARRRKKSKRGGLVPNDYTLRLSEADYQRLCSARVTDSLYEALEKQVILKKTFMDGDLRIHLQKAAELTDGMCEVSSCYAEADCVGGGEPEPDTIVLERRDFAQPLNLPKEHKTVSLTVTEGPDEGAYLEFGERQIYIGRRDKNDFILTDSGASRLHAYIKYERHRHVLYDAQSLNGTFLNGEPVTSLALCAGDEIRLGNTVLLYEVI